MKKFVKRVTVGAVVVVGVLLGLNGFGFGGGSGIGFPAFNPSVEKSNEGEQKDETIATIKIEESNIYVDEEKCANIDELKDKISKINSKGKVKKYIFVHDKAIKSTYDEVKQALISLEETLKITVDYNE